MSLFGQVWLWSIAAFLAGVLLTWMFLVRPVQARNRKLERRLREARTAPVSAPPRRPARPAPPAEDKRQPADRYPSGPGFADRHQPEPVLTDVYQPDPGLTDRFEPEPQTTAQFRADAAPADRPQTELQPVDGYLGEPGVPPGHQSELQPVDGYPAEPGMPPGYQPEPADRSQPDSESFWATFDPEPEPEAGEEQRELAWFERDRADKAGADKEEAQPLPSPATEFVGLSSVLEPEKPADAGVTSVFTKIDDAPAEDRGSERGSLFPSDTPVPAVTPEPASPTYAFGGDQKPAGNEAATEVTQVLPRRKPQKTPRSAFEPPRKRAEPSMRPIERREPVLLDEGGQSGSLFEPVTPANSAQASGDKASAEGSAREAAVPSGPFGPGSAMPRPGGGRPADDFAVKASVTALRYCTEESPQYARMVAEVWFRTAADAERVGFRPVS